MTKSTTRYACNVFPLKIAKFSRSRVNKRYANTHTREAALEQNENVDLANSGGCEKKREQHGGEINCFWLCAEGRMMKQQVPKSSKHEAVIYLSIPQSGYKYILPLEMGNTCMENFAHQVQVGAGGCKRWRFKLSLLLRVKRFYIFVFVKRNFSGKISLFCV